MQCVYIYIYVVYIRQVFIQFTVLEADALPIRQPAPDARAGFLGADFEVELPAGCLLLLRTPLLALLRHRGPPFHRRGERPLLAPAARWPPMLLGKGFFLPIGRLIALLLFLPFLLQFLLMLLSSLSWPSHCNIFSRWSAAVSSVSLITSAEGCSCEAALALSTEDWRSPAAPTPSAEDWRCRAALIDAAEDWRCTTLTPAAAAPADETAPPGSWG